MASILPQLVPFGDRVECVVSDNASSDRTPRVIERYAQQFPLRHFRNPTNIGILGNITKVATELASGDYVWLLGDDDVLTAGAVQRLMAELDSETAPALIALNVGYLPHQHRPGAEDIFGGTQQQPATTLRPLGPTRRCRFEQLLTGPCADFTASYSVVLRRQTWRDEFPAPYLDPPFTCVRDTYPHAYLIATRLTGCEAVLIGPPAVMVFEVPEEQFSWSRYRAINALAHATSLLKLYERHGVAKRILEPYHRYQLRHRVLLLGDLMWNRDCAGSWPETLRFLWMEKRHPWLLSKAVYFAMLHQDAPRWLRRPFQVLQRLKRRLAGA